MSKRNPWIKCWPRSVDLDYYLMLWIHKECYDSEELSVSSNTMSDDTSQVQKKMCHMHLPVGHYTLVFVSPNSSKSPILRMYQLCTWWSCIVRMECFSSLKAVQHLKIWFLHSHTTHCPFPHNCHCPVDVEKAVPHLARQASQGTFVDFDPRLLSFHLPQFFLQALKIGVLGMRCPQVYLRELRSLLHMMMSFGDTVVYKSRIFSGHCQISDWMYEEVGLLLLTVWYLEDLKYVFLAWRAWYTIYEMKIRRFEVDGRVDGWWGLNPPLFIDRVSPSNWFSSTSGAPFSTVLGNAVA